MPRDRIAGFSSQEDVGLERVIAELRARVDRLEKQAVVRPTQSTNFLARPGEQINVEAPGSGLVATLVQATPFTRGARVTFVQLNANPVTFRAINGTVNGQTLVISNAPGTYVAISDGKNGWSLDQGITAVGVPGAPGTPGATGSQGSPGPQGDQGDEGPAGPMGPQGLLGPVGMNGPAGSDGQDGADGVPGPKGDKGDIGPAGPPGADGADGADGPPGPAGATGATGAAGSGGTGGAEGIILDPTEVLNFVRTSGTWDLETSHTDSDGTLGSTTTAAAVATTALATAPGALDRTIVECSIYCVVGGSFSVTAGGVTVLGPLTLIATERVEFTAAQGWRVFGTTGAEKSTPGPTGATGPVGPNVPVGIVLSDATHSLESSISGGTYDIEAGYYDATTTTVTPGSSSFDAVGNVTIAGHPGGAVSRIIDYVSLVAITAGTMTVRKNVGGVFTTLVGPLTLAVGERIEFTGLEGWKAFNADGSPRLLDTIGTARSIYGVAGTSNAARADIPSSSDNTFLRRTTGALSWGQLTNAMIPATTIGLDKLTQINDNQVLGNGSGSSASAVGLTCLEPIFTTPTSIGIDTAFRLHIVKYDEDGAGAAICFRKDTAGHFFYDDFDYVSPIGAVTTTGTAFNGGTTAWWVQGLVASGNVTGLNGDNNHPGILQLESGATNGNGLRLFRGAANSPTVAWIRFDEVYSMQCVVRLPSVTSVYFEVGFATNPLATYTNACVFYYDSAVSANWRLFTEEGGTPTDTDTGTAAGAAAWTRLEFIQEVSGTVDFYIDEALELSTSSNIPDTETVNLGFGVITRTNALKQADVDYISFESANMGQRST